MTHMVCITGIDNEKQTNGHMTKNRYLSLPSVPTHVAMAND